MSNVGMNPGNELAGKVALVTGGARNIGRAIARSLAAGGAAVMVNAKTSRAQADETVAIIEQAGGSAAVHIADVTDPRAVATMVEATVKRFGRIDALVNNAAVRMEMPFEKIGRVGIVARAHDLTTQAQRRRPRGVDCNRDGPPPFAAAHG